MPISRRKFLLSSAAIAGAAFITDAWWFEKYFIETKEFFLGKANKESETIKFLQFSDLHLKQIKSHHRNLAKHINELKPNMIMITGDSIEQEKKLGLLSNFLAMIDHDIPKVAIIGNWEYFGLVNKQELRKVYADHNCDLLLNENKQYRFKNKTFSITGIDDYLSGNSDVETAMKNHQNSDYHLVLNHCPAYTKDIINHQKEQNRKVDYIFSGHTHGGQVNILGFVPFLPFGSGKYVRGWYQENMDDPKMYVSKGIGTTFIPLRFGSRAEIALFHFQA